MSSVSNGGFTAIRGVPGTTLRRQPTLHREVPRERRQAKGSFIASSCLAFTASRHLVQRTTGRRVLSLDLPGLLPPREEAKEAEGAGRLFHAHGPVGLQRLRLSSDLLEFLFEDLAPDVPTLLATGFQSCVDHPQLPGHHYLEGYFHTLPMDLAVPSPNVRSGAADAAKPPAPQRLAAFGEALRRKNRRLLEELAEQCPAGSPLRAVLGSDRVFGDLAVQIHWGDAVEDQDVAWHVDANNSALHMAVSLRGRRTLQMRLCDPFALETKVVQEPQQPGDVYIGNPAAYEHGLTYAAATWEKRMVALQLRLLLTEAELRDAHFLEGMALVARRVSTAPFELPSLEDVRNCLSTRS